MESIPTVSSFEKWMITITVMLVAVIEVLDITIVNVSLPHMMATLGTTSAEITWILTAYIVSAAIFMPLTGMLIRQLGLRFLLLLNIFGFLIASMLCGAATTLAAMVFFRILQGIFGASLVPISQYVLRNTFSRAEQGKAMAIWGIGIMIAPILGPNLGGYITEALNWRWIFYINAPICSLAFVMALNFIKETPRAHEKIDWQGLLIMALAVGSLQTFIDRGNNENWFDSNLIICLASITVVSFTLFIYRGWNKANNIINLRLFTERHFAMSSLLLMLYFAGFFGTIILQTMMLEMLLKYPADVAGNVMAPRGIASAIAMLMGSQLNKYFDNRMMILTGILITAFGTYQMAAFNLSASCLDYIIPGCIQGLGMGFTMVPLLSAAFDYLDKNQTAEAAGLFSFGRSIGMSIGISISNTLITRQSLVNWQRLGAHIQLTNPNFIQWASSQHLTVYSPLTLQLAARQVQQQSAMIAFIDAFLAAGIFLTPLAAGIFLLKKSKAKLITLRK